MVHLLTNAHNSSYNRILHSPIQSHSASIVDATTLPNMVLQMGNDQLTRNTPNQINQLPVSENIAQVVPAATPGSLKGTLDRPKSYQPSFLSSMNVGYPIPNDQKQRQQQQDIHSLPVHGPNTPTSPAANQKRGSTTGTIAKSLLSMHRESQKHPYSDTTSQINKRPERERSIQPQQAFLTTDQYTSIDSDGAPSNEVQTSMSIAPSDFSSSSPPSPTTPLSEPPVIKPITKLGTSDNNHMLAMPNMPPCIPTFIVGSVVLIDPSFHILAASPLHSGESDNDGTKLDIERGSRAKAFFHLSEYDAPGYNLIGLHWIIYIGTQIILISLLFVLFLGVLVLTEYALDLEDDDTANLGYYYWARVVGITMTTIVSAIHGSLLSGYVIVDGQSDWIAKAAVGATCVYWGIITWATNRIAGPLPY
ncbi:hypothetical protein BGZ46_005375 [Entomortierella lignicola]|nr:hypothetical protein BGZ46_005375 [Entomortierella lignicola]